MPHPIHDRQMLYLADFKLTPGQGRATDGHCRAALVIPNAPTPGPSAMKRLPLGPAPAFCCCTWRSSGDAGKAGGGGEGGGDCIVLQHQSKFVRAISSRWAFNPASWIPMPASWMAGLTTEVLGNLRHGMQLSGHSYTCYSQRNVTYCASIWRSSFAAIIRHQSCSCAADFLSKIGS